MRVAIVHSYYSSRQPSGENVVVDAQASALRENGVDVRVIAARTDQLATRPGYRVRSAVAVGTGVGPSPMRELEEFRPDVVHVHNLFPNWGTRWLREWTGPVVATVHNFRPACAAGTLFRDGRTCTLCPDTGSMSAVRHACYRGSRVATIPLALRTRRGIAGDSLLSRSDRVVLLSPRARELYVSFGLPVEKIAVIPNFVDDVGFSPARPPGQEWVYIGRLTEEKGVRGLLNHWPDGAMLNIFGDGPLRAEVETAAAERAGIRYHGSLLREDVPGALGEGRGLIFPSECAEGFPTVYAEALAAGRPVVARAGNSAADDVADASTGAVFSEWSGLGRALSAATSPLITPEVVRKRYEEAFTREVWLRHILREYRRFADTEAVSSA